PFALQDPPAFAQQLLQVVAVLDAVDQQDAIDTVVGKRQRLLVDEARAEGTLRRPVDHPLSARHEGEHTLRLSAKLPQVGSGIAQAENDFSTGVWPELANLPPNEMAGHLAGAAGIEIRQIEDVVPHVAMVKQLTSCWKPVGRARTEEASRLSLTRIPPGARAYDCGATTFSYSGLECFQRFAIKGS